MSLLNQSLLEAVQHNRPLSVKRLLELGADPNYSEDCAQLASLHIAVTFEFVEVIPPSVTAGAGIHAETDEGITPLEFAISINKRQVIRHCCKKF